MKRYKELFNSLPASDALRQEVQNMTTQDRTVKRFSRLPKVAAIAAVAAVLLAGTALAANLFGIRDWFAEQWREETGTAISTDQLGLIDQLTQEIGASDTDNDVTVTVDSATRGEGILWLLLRIEGEVPVTEGADLYSEVGLTFSPEIETAGFAYSIEDAGVREDGSLMALLRYVPPLTGEDTLLGGYDVTLTLKGLYWDGEPAAEDSWEIDFSLEEMEAPEALTLSESLFARAISLENPEEPLEVEHRDIRITPTEIWLTRDNWGEELHVFSSWGLLMKDGSTIDHNGGVVYDLPDGQVESVYYWRVPVDLSQAAGLAYGDTVIPVE